MPAVTQDFSVGDCVDPFDPLQLPNPIRRYTPSGFMSTHLLDGVPQFIFPQAQLVPPPVPEDSYPRNTQKTGKKPNKARECIQVAFGRYSPFPNEALAKLLPLIVGSSFISAHQLEPTIDSEEGQALLSEIVYFTDCPPRALQISNLSIFTLMVDFSSRKCLICGSSKTSIDRAVGCIRSHLDHRPFVCGGGGSICCVRCGKKAT
jgi:hypothetical protein